MSQFIIIGTMKSLAIRGSIFANDEKQAAYRMKQLGYTNCRIINFNA